MQHDDMVCMLTNVHKSCCRQYSKASLDRQGTKNWARGYQCNGKGITMEGYHDTKMIWRLPSVAMMSGGVLDVDTKMMETHP